MRRCNAMRTPEKRPTTKRQPRSYRCRNEATRAVGIHQENGHMRIASGWFEVEVCDSCFFRSEAGALVETKLKTGRWNWRYL